MRSDDESFSGDELNWTPDELAQIEALRAERKPPVELKRRTANALRARGLLRGRRPVTPRVAALLAAAATVVFAAGALVGYAAAMRRTTLREADHGPPRAVAQTDSAVVTPRGARQVVWF